MKDVSTLTAGEILAINQPEHLFTGDEAQAKVEFKKLASLWHTDTNPDVDKHVMPHINMLYDQAKMQLGLGIWVKPGEVIFTSVDKRQFCLKYRKHRQFELGDMYIGDTIVAFSIFKDNEDLYKNAVKMMRFKYANDAMKGEIARYLPTIKTEIETEERYIMLVDKTPDLLLLRDVLDFYKGKMDPKHVAWILSSLYNLSCYLKYSKLVHANFSPDTIFISPGHHSVALLGGWWYTTEHSRKLLALSAEAVDQAPASILDDQIADYKLDLELLRAVGRELLGDINGSRLIADKNIPSLLLNWLRSPSPAGDAFIEYKTWKDDVLIKSFGKRRYVELNLSSSEVYK